MHSDTLFATLILTIGQMQSESLALICLDESNLLLGTYQVAFGSERRLSASYRSLLGCALGDNATKIIVAHNHPSGIAYPSKQDRIATKALVAVLRTVEIELVDHIIVTRSEAFSMKLAKLV